MLGDGSPEVASTKTNLGRVLLDMENHAAAEALLRESLGVREQVLPDDWSRFHTASLLGGSLWARDAMPRPNPYWCPGTEG